MTSDEQLYGSRKYTVAPVTILPDGDSYLVGSGYSPGRDFIGRMTAEALLAFIPSLRAIERPQAPPLSLAIDIEL